MSQRSYTFKNEVCRVCSRPIRFVSEYRQQFLMGRRRMVLRYHAIHVDDETDLAEGKPRPSSKYQLRRQLEESCQARLDG